MNYYRFRFVIAIFVFIFFKLTNVDSWQDFITWNLISTISIVYTISVILILWEVLYRYIKRQRELTDLTTNKGLYIISTKAALLALPLVFLFSFIYSEFLTEFDCCKEEQNQGTFLINSAQGFVISLLIIAYEIILLYVKNAIKNAQEKERIQKELSAAKLEGLKNQVNPHFLFNSFSVLTSLVEDNSKQAVDFISKLSDMYRYILENDEKTTVTLKEELNFTDSYIFLLSIRHQSAIVIDKMLNLPEEKILVPPMSIQILIENAVKHNSFTDEDPLYITIRNDGDRMIIVENEKRKKDNLSASTQIGLKNLSNRLILSAGKALEILDSEKIFQVRIPLSKI